MGESAGVSGGNGDWLAGPRGSNHCKLTLHQVTSPAAGLRPWELFQASSIMFHTNFMYNHAKFIHNHAIVSQIHNRHGYCTLYDIYTLVCGMISCCYTNGRKNACFLPVFRNTTRNRSNLAGSLAHDPGFGPTWIELAGLAPASMA